MSLLHESTINALQIYGFTETAIVLQLFVKLWSVLNVSSSTIGKHKRDITRDSVRSADNWKVEFLLEFENFATFWKNSSVSYGFVLNKIKLLKEYINLSILVPLCISDCFNCRARHQIDFLYVRLRYYYITMFQLSYIPFCLYLLRPSFSHLYIFS